LERTIEGFSAVGEDALAWWRLRALHPTTGSWPLLLAPRLWERSFGEYSTYQSPADSLAEVARLDGRQVIADCRDGDGRPAGDGVDVLAVEAARAWPGERWTCRIQIIRNPSGGPAEVTVALVPVQQLWQIPAVLNYGGWNDLMRPADTAAVLRHWHQRYGAVLLGLGYPNAEMLVDRPPRTRHEALQLAYEHAIYDPDWPAVINREHLVDLAATLLDSEVWHFWWD
jgi:Domain of unknown function (DUF4253)